ncbi:SMI1/KNR4 family protein [Kitasatospora cineracea]
MGLPKWISDVVETRQREFVDSPDDVGIFGPPVLRAGATEAEITRLQARFSHPLEEDYIEFLRHSDGMENYALGMPIYGSRDWSSGRVQDESGQFLRIQAELLHDDAEIPEGTEIVPISMNTDRTAGTFMVPQGDYRGRIFWVGHGDLCFYSGIRSLFRWAVNSDPGEIDWIL